MSSTVDWLLVGLGNPGTQYQDTRHNVGFRVLEVLVERHKVALSKSEFDALTGKFKFKNQSLMLCLPQTFMNDSGRAVSGLARYYKIPIQKILVVYDDLDFDLGTLKLRAQGSGGTHNGMNSIISCLGLQIFPRLRVGIGPKPTAAEWKDFVLSKFRKDEKKLLSDVLIRGVVAVEQVCEVGIERGMNAVNGT